MAHVKGEARITLPTDEFVGRLESLYGEVEKWLRGTKLTLRRGRVIISEESIPRYTAPSLSIHNPEGHELASLKPVGIRILGAEARVDLVGAYGSRPIRYLSPGGPRLATSTHEGGQVLETHTRPLFPGVGREGWYTVDQLRPRAHLLDNARFRDLVRKVSDHAI
jgi:hypothetical protein